jgi:hypothetical protein
MRGRSLPLSRPRRLIADLMWLSTGIPRVTVQRRMDLAPLLRARAAAKDRPSWSAIFVKGYALLAAETPELRRAYVKLPWPHLYEYPESIAAIAQERSYRGENAVLQTKIKTPERLPIACLSTVIRDDRIKPVEEVREFRRLLAWAAAPLPVRRLLMWLGLNMARQRANRFGTFQLSVYSALGAESLNPLSPLTTLFNYGPIDPSGQVTVRIMYDHRVADGATVARALERFEAILNGPVADEIGPAARPTPAQATMLAFPRS